MKIAGGFSLGLKEYFWSWGFFAIFSFLTALKVPKSNPQMKKFKKSTEMIEIQKSTEMIEIQILLRAPRAVKNENMAKNPQETKIFF